MVYFIFGTLCGFKVNGQSVTSIPSISSSGSGDATLPTPVISAINWTQIVWASQCALEVVVSLPPINMSTPYIQSLLILVHNPDVPNATLFYSTTWNVIIPSLVSQSNSMTLSSGDVIDGNDYIFLAAVSPETALQAFTNYGPLSQPYPQTIRYYAFDITHCPTTPTTSASSNDLSNRNLIIICSSIAGIVILFIITLIVTRNKKKHESALELNQVLITDNVE